MDDLVHDRTRCTDGSAAPARRTSTVARYYIVKTFPVNFDVESFECCDIAIYLQQNSNRISQSERIFKNQSHLPKL